MKKLILLILFIIPAQVSALNLFQIGIGLTSTSVMVNGTATTQYTYTFNLKNLGPDPDEIFKWEFSNGSNLWNTVGSTAPEEWNTGFPGSKIMEWTNNGTANNSARIAPGETLTFTWTFTLGSGPMPTTEFIGSVHFQPVETLSNGEVINVGETYKVTTPVPEPATLLLMGFGLTGLALYRRFSKKINKN